MKAVKLPNGNLLVPMRAEDAASGVVGDGMVEVKPGTKLYRDWSSFVKPDRKARPPGKTKPARKK